MAPILIRITQDLSCRTPRSSILPDGLLDGSVTGQRSTDGKESVEVQRRNRATIDILPDDALLEIFHSYRVELDGDISSMQHHDRVIKIRIEDFSLETFSAMIQKPFPVLAHLELLSFGEIAPILHKEFLGGLRHIPITGYISPEAMATCLATLPSLKYLFIGFESPRSRPDRIGLPPPTRAVLPALEHFELKGVSEYVEDLVARIDTPKLDWLKIYLFMDLMFNIPHLYKFIVRAEEIRSLNAAEIAFSSSATEILLGHPTGTVSLEIICREPGWRASSMTQLDIREGTPGQARQQNSIDPTLFLDLLDPFPAMRRLHVYGELRPLVARALQELAGESATEVLPSLRGLVFRGPSPSGSIQKDIQGFITARQNSNRPVDVEWRE
ncbi:hypothetical protein BJV74DRAFT_954271 [Russula compacta]|nr:hypothetical protein BJV74DRAFT_954271 [Russula compacta]